VDRWDNQSNFNIQTGQMMLRAAAETRVL